MSTKAAGCMSIIVMKILLIEPGKTARAAELENNLSAMQKTVGGPIQALYPWEDPVALVCNDEGKNEGLQLNRMLEDYDIVAGTFFLCGMLEDLTNRDQRMVDSFDEDAWYALVDYVTVCGKEDVRFTFKNGVEIRV